MSIETLVDMLSYRRPAGSKAEKKFIRRFIAPTGAQPDDYGNYILRIGTAPILWSSHTDTVHRSAGRQTVDTSRGWASVKHQNCLGADCTVGVYLMLEMIKAGVEGLYIFHREEESGGGGSTHIAMHEKDKLLAGIQAAIAFDRYGYRSIITHQWGGRCCSTAFAESLSEALTTERLTWKLDDGGTFTDTANYTEIIPECTNISVGYFGQHTKTETCDLWHIMVLRDKLLSADFSKLVIAREPEPMPVYGRAYGSSGYNDWGFDSWEDNYYPKGYKGTARDTSTPYEAKDGDYIYSSSTSTKSSSGTAYDRLLRLAKQDPEAVAGYLDMYGIGADEIEKKMGVTFARAA